jgi:hypothetical protein
MGPIKGLIWDELEHPINLPPNLELAGGLASRDSSRRLAYLCLKQIRSGVPALKPIGSTSHASLLLDSGQRRASPLDS